MTALPGRFDCEFFNHTLIGLPRSSQIAEDFRRSQVSIAPAPMAKKASVEGSGTGVISRTCIIFNCADGITGPGFSESVSPPELSATKVPKIYCPGPLAPDP